MGWLSLLFTFLFYIIMGVIIYIITDKYSYIVNVSVYAVITTIIVIFSLPEITFGSIVLQLIFNIIVGLIVIGVAQSIRDGFEYDTIIGYLIIVGIVHTVATAIVRGIISLF